jgi:hypothetical protein
MKIRSMGLAPLLAAGVAGLAIAVAPISDASPTTSVNGAGRSSDSSGAGRGFQMDGVQTDDDRVTGDVEINSSHTVQFPPPYPDFGSRGIYHHGHHHH